MSNNNIYNKQSTINFVSGPCGSGKTHSLSKYIKQNLFRDSKYIITVPSKLLADQIYAQLKEDHKDLYLIHSDTSEKVTSAILKTIKEINFNESGILIITQQAFQRIPFFQNKDTWVLISDEIPQIDSFYNLTLPYNFLLLTNYITTEEAESKAFYKINLVSDEILKKESDDVYKLFKPLIKKLSDGHDVYTDKTNWDKIVNDNVITKDSQEDSRYGNSSNMLFFLTIQTPTLYSGFKKTIMMGANFEHSMLYKLWSEQYNINFNPFKPILDNLRYTTHTNGNRLHIKYTQEEKASKYSSKKMIGDLSREQKRTEIVNELFKDKPFIFMSNNDSKEDDNLAGIRIPVISHGLNKFDTFHNIYFSPALNRMPKHSKMLEELGVDSVYLARASSHEIAYQGILRTSMRNPEATEEVTVVVVDKATAESLARLFPECTIGAVDGVARKTTSNFSQSNCDKTNKLKKLQSLLALNSPSRYDIESLNYNCNSIKTKGITIQNETIQASFIKTIKDTELRSFSGSKLEFVSYLSKTFTSNLIKEKDETYLFNLSSYNSANDRHLENVHHSDGVIVDIDNGDLSPEEFKQIFTEKGYSFCMMNSFSRSVEKPNNYRVIFFVKGIINDDVYRDIQIHIQNTVKEFDYISCSNKEKERLQAIDPSLKFSGIDLSKCHSTSFFYVPCRVIGREEHAFFWKVNMASLKQLERCAINPDKIIKTMKEKTVLSRICMETVNVDHNKILTQLMSGNYCFEDHLSYGYLAAAMYNSGFSLCDFRMVTPFVMRTKRKSDKDIDLMWKNWSKYDKIGIGSLIWMMK